MDCTLSLNKDFRLPMQIPMVVEILYSDSKYSATAARVGAAKGKGERGAVGAS